jgi:hypothetical protein
MFRSDFLKLIAALILLCGPCLGQSTFGSLTGSLHGTVVLLRAGQLARNSQTDARPGSALRVASAVQRQDAATGELQPGVPGRPCCGTGSKPHCSGVSHPSGTGANVRGVQGTQRPDRTGNGNLRILHPNNTSTGTRSSCRPITSGGSGTRCRDSEWPRHIRVFNGAGQAIQSYREIDPPVRSDDDQSF